MSSTGSGEGALDYDGGFALEGGVLLAASSGGTYSGGTLLTELTISDSLTTYGQVGMGGSRGGNLIGEAGQHGSFGRNGMEDQDGMRPEFPDGAEGENAPGGPRGDRSGMEPPVP